MRRFSRFGTPTIRLRVAGCPAKADTCYGTMKGQGSPPDGRVVPSNVSAGLSHPYGFDVCFATSCEALVAVKPTGEPPPPLVLAGDGGALTLAEALPPAGQRAVPGRPNGAVECREVPSPTASPQPGVNSPPPAAAAQLATQLMTTRWEATAGGFRPELPTGSHRRLKVDQAHRRGAAEGLDGKDRVHERPAQRVARPEPPLAGTAPGDTLRYRLPGQVLAIVAVLALSFLVELTLLGNLRHDRDQAQLAAQFRIELAQPTAPVGPVDEANVPLVLGRPVALLEIPRLGLREVVVEGTSAQPLMSGPGHRRDTPLPGQVGTSVVSGRRATYGGPFHSIDQLRAGDEITVTTGQGRHSFAVIGVRRPGDPVPPALAPGGGRLTLVTAGGQVLRPADVLRVDAALTSATQPRPAQLPSQALRPAEAVMAGDRSALLGVVIWLVLLVAAAIATVWVRFRAGPWQAWVIGVPVLVTLGLIVADEIAAMLPNLL